MTSYEYRKLLRHPEWLRVRAEILRRDKYSCQECGSYYPIRFLHVHHLQYYNGMPWETPYSKLITLCKRCHLHVYHESKRKKKGDQN
jgi:5-methylcytosine-specific restriction endonuclease McrA